MVNSLPVNQTGNILAGNGAFVDILPLGRVAVAAIHGYIPIKRNMLHHLEVGIGPAGSNKNLYIFQDNLMVKIRWFQQIDLLLHLLF